MPLIEVDDLTKQFRRPVKDPGLRGAVKHLFTRDYTTHVAVDHVSLSIEAGEAVAYVGPNGAGKSTTIKMLTGILVPTSGSAHIRQCPCRRPDSVRAAHRQLTSDRCGVRAAHAIVVGPAGP